MMKMIKVVYSHDHVKHIPKHEIDKGKFIENYDKSERIERIREKLIVHEMGDFVEPHDFPISYLYTVHSPVYIEWLKNKAMSLKKNDEYFPEVFGYDRCFDTGTPIMRNTFEQAWLSAKMALTGAKLILEDEDFVYCLCRPPGHHANSLSCGGYCYFNNAALAAFYILKEGFDVAILDLDFHHFNGTQDIFYASNLLTISIHGHPNWAYPWISGFEWENGEDEGLGRNINIPLEKGTKIDEYLKSLELALSEIENYDPDFLIVSLGFDTHEDDPQGGFSLKTDDYESIGKMLGETDYPLLFIQEGGYNPEANANAALKFFKGVLR